MLLYHFASIFCIEATELKRSCLDKMRVGMSECRFVLDWVRNFFIKEKFFIGMWNGMCIWISALVFFTRVVMEGEFLANSHQCSCSPRLVTRTSEFK